MDNDTLAIIGNLYVANIQLSKAVATFQETIAEQQNAINQFELNQQANKKVLQLISDEHPDVAKMLNDGFTVKAES